MTTTGLTRPHWAGADAALDIHIEAYQGDVDRAFEYNSYFKGKVQPKSVEGASNTWRGDRFGAAVVKTRGAGTTPEKDRIVNEKFTITVDLTSYVRTAIDYQDEWTAPSRRAEITSDHGSEMALAYDQAHLIQLIHSRTWTPPASLVGKGFFNGIDKTATVSTVLADGNLTPEEKAEQVAYAYEKAHRDVITELVKRRVPMGEVETLVRPECFSALMDHKKLMNVDFSNGNGAFAARRMAMMNGVRVVELNCWPDVVDPAHKLGSAFNVTADDLLVQMVVWHTQKTLVTVEAQAQIFRIWDDEENFTNVLDTYSMYTVGQRRPDYAGCVSKDA